MKKAAPGLSRNCLPTERDGAGPQSLNPRVGGHVAVLTGGFSDRWIAMSHRNDPGEKSRRAQKLMADLFEIGVNTVKHHLKEIFADGELQEAATIRKYRIVRSEGKRQIAREVEHYSLPVIPAVGYRVRSHRGTQFRQWATARLSEYLVKGFTMDDERLKNPPGKGRTDYFDELLERIRDIRSSERRFYQKVLDIYATSVDYDPHR